MFHFIETEFLSFNELETRMGDIFYWKAGNHIGVSRSTACFYEIVFCIYRYEKIACFRGMKTYRDRE